MCFILIKTVMTISSPFVCCCCFPQPLTWYGQLRRGGSVSEARPPPQHCHLLALTGLSRTRSHVPLCCGADAWPVPNMSGGSDYTPRWPVGPTVRPPSGQPCGDCRRDRADWSSGREPASRLTASPRSAQVSSAPANGKQFSPIR